MSLDLGDADAEAAARAELDRKAKPRGSLGRLAEALAEMSIAALSSSPRRRAVATAAPVALGLADDHIFRLDQSCAGSA